MKAIWVSLSVLCLALAGFIIYLTFTNPEPPMMRGMVLAAALAAIGLYPLTKLRQRPAEPPLETPSEE